MPQNYSSNDPASDLLVQLQMFFSYDENVSDATSNLYHGNTLDYLTCLYNLLLYNYVPHGVVTNAYVCLHSVVTVTIVYIYHCLQFFPMNN